MFTDVVTAHALFSTHSHTFYIEINQIDVIQICFESSQLYLTEHNLFISSEIIKKTNSNMDHARLPSFPLRRGSRDISRGSRDISRGSRDISRGFRDISRGSRDISRGSRDINSANFALFQYFVFLP